MNVRRGTSIYLLALGCAIGSAQCGNAEEPAEKSKDDRPTRFVIRISRDFIRKHALPTIEVVKPIDRCLFGAHVTGFATTKGKTTVNMDLREVDASFTFHFSGTTISHTEASRRPVVVFSSGQVDFVAQCEMFFDGLRFTNRPATIEATQSSTTDGLATPRLFERTIRAKTMLEVERTKPEADAIELRDTKKEVLIEFNKESDRLVKQLNEVIPLEKTVGFLVPRTKGWITHVGSTKDYLLASPGPKEAHIPVLPKEFSRMRAPLEIWMHGKPEGEVARGLIESWSVAHHGLDRFRGLITGKEVKPEGLKFTAVGEWWVIKIGEDLLAKWVEKEAEKNGK